MERYYNFFPKFSYTAGRTQYQDEYCTKKNHVRKPRKVKPVWIPAQRAKYRKTVSATQPWLPKQADATAQTETNLAERPSSGLKNGNNSYAVQQVPTVQFQMPAQKCNPTEEQRAYIQSMTRCGSKELSIARQEALGGSVDFRDKRTYSAPPPGVNYEQKMTRSSPMPFDPRSDHHWIAWATGPLQPPGLQKQLARPWPTPPAGARRISSAMHGRVASAAVTGAQRCSSARATGPAPVQASRRPTPPRPVVQEIPRAPVSDNIGSVSIHPPAVMLNQEECFAPEPTVVDVNKHVQFNQLANFRSWDAPAGSMHHEDNMPILLLQRLKAEGRGCKRTLFIHPVNRERREVRRAFNDLKNVNSNEKYARYKRTAYDVCPKSYHRPRKSASNDTAAGSDTVNHDSFFMYTKPRLQGHFTIHPDWVSETAAVKKSAKHYTSSKGDQSFRYGSK